MLFLTRFDPQVPPGSMLKVGLDVEFALKSMLHMRFDPLQWVPQQVLWRIFTQCDPKNAR